MSAKREGLELRKLWGAFRVSRVLMTANTFRFFDHLRSPKTAEELAAALATDHRATEIMLNALAGMNLVKKQRSGIRRRLARYKNTGLANRILVKGQPYYQGDIIEHAATLWDNWSGLDDVLRSGQPARRSRDLDSFIMGMHNLATLRAPDVIKILDLKGVKRTLDLGGGPGTYSMALARKVPDVTLFDYPDTLAIAREVVGKAGVTNVSFKEGDFMAEDIGHGYDLIFISQIAHAYSTSENIQLIKRSRHALNPGGRIAVQEFLIDDSLAHPLSSALFSVNMLVNTPEGRCYTPREIKQWLVAAGFGNVKIKKMDDNVVVIAKLT